jgi:hypothetical protein
MSFVEIELFGVLISPAVPLGVLAVSITVALHWLAVELGWVRSIWHPALFEFSVFLIILTATVLIFRALRIYG